MTTADLVSKLQSHLAALGDGGDCRSINERTAYRLTYDRIQGTISALRNLPYELADELAQIDVWQAARVTTLAKQAAIEQEIAAAPDLTTIADSRLRDKEETRQIQLDLSLKRLAAGRLLVAGQALYALDVIDGRIAELTQRRDRAQLQLDAHLNRAAQILAPEPVTS